MQRINKKGAKPTDKKKEERKQQQQCWASAEKKKTQEYGTHCVYMLMPMLTFSSANSTMSRCVDMPAKQITSGFGYDDKVSNQQQQ